jgi:hypothetical protein
MTPELYVWLEEVFYKDNHKKYHKYFEEWVINITEHQIQSFSKMEQNRNIYEKQN